MYYKWQKVVLGKEASKKLELVLLSNNVIQSQIGDLSLDILDQVIKNIKASHLKISFKLKERNNQCWKLHSNCII